VIKQVAKEAVANGLLVMATRTGFTCTEILGLPFSRFIANVRAFLPKDS